MTAAPARMRAIRGQAVSLTGNPFLSEGCLQHVADALILIEDGRITAFGQDFACTLPGCQLRLDRGQHGRAHAFYGRLVLGFLGAGDGMRSP